MSGSVIAEGYREDLTQQRLIPAIREAAPSEELSKRLVLRCGDSGLLMRAQRFIEGRLGAYMDAGQLALDFGRLDNGCWELVLEEE